MPNTKKTMRRSVGQVKTRSLLYKLLFHEEEQMLKPLIAERRHFKRGTVGPIPDATPSYGYETRLL